jgi:hypothetical protein
VAELVRAQSQERSREVLKEIESTSGSDPFLLTLNADAPRVNSAETLTRGGERVHAIKQESISRSDGSDGEDTAPLSSRCAPITEPPTRYHRVMDGH